jgi:aspartyl-tRNA(Asn)/glutamyl-tRNA(Gln) amidotransferase subunit C
MERVTPETVDAVARLARLSLDPGERELFARQLGDILAWADSLAALDTEGVPPMAHPGRASALREDEPRPGLDRGTVLEGAPDPAEGLFRVPRVLGG